MKCYYVDSCIYLNLWKKEVDESGNLLWKFAKEFFEKAEDENSIIYYSGFLLKELMFILSTEEYLNKRELFESSPNFKKVMLSQEEYDLAGKIKNENAQISFFDIIHTLFAKKTDSILVTRDKELIEFAKSINVEAKSQRRFYNFPNLFISSISIGSLDSLFLILLTSSTEFLLFFIVPASFSHTSLLTESLITSDLLE